MTEHYIIIDRHSGDVIGISAVMEQATILTNNWKQQRPRQVQEYTVVNPEDLNVEIRLYKEL